MLKQILLSLIVISIPISATLADAGKDGHKHSQPEKAAPSHSKHGGIVGDSGHHHVELVAKDNSIEFYVESEDFKPEDVTNAKATASILVGGKVIEVPMASSDGKSLKGTGTFAAAKGTVIVVTLTMPDHQPEQARFTLK